MSSALNLLQSAAGPHHPNLILAHVTDGQPLPSGFDDPLYVTPPWNPHIFWKIYGWPAIHGATLPAVGADCLIAVDDYGNQRCLWWHGTHS